MTTKLASVLTLVLTVANARAADETALDAAIGAVIRATESSVVQLRYYGAGADTLGAAAAPVTGRLVSEGWVLTSLYGLADDPAGVLCINGCLLAYSDASCATQR